MPRIGVPEFPLEEQKSTGYPFDSAALLRNAAGDTIPPGTFIDAKFYPVSGGLNLYLSSVTVAHATITLTIGDDSDATLASCSFPVANAPSLLAFKDTYGRAVGVIVSDSVRLGVFQAWSLGAHDFTSTETGFVASLVVPGIAQGVQAITLQDGTIFTDDVWFVGADGTVLAHTTETVAGARGEPDVTYQVIRVDFVGDALFKRAVCDPLSLFTTPRYLRMLQVSQGDTTFMLTPDANGNVTLFAGNNLALQSVLRLSVRPGQLLFKAMGTTNN